MEIINISDKRYNVKYKTIDKHIDNLDIVKKRTSSTTIIRNNNTFLFVDEIKDAEFKELNGDI